MTIASKLSAFAALAAFSLVAHPAAAQSTISFGDAQNISGDSDVATDGTLLAAYSTGTGTTNATVNGVTFIAVGQAGGPDVAITNGVQYNFGGPFAANTAFGGLSTAYQTVLRQNDYANGSLGVTLNGLTPGDDYEFQLFVCDPRGATARTDSITDNLGDVSGSVAFNTGGTGGLGQFILGTFTANDISQAFTVSPVDGTGGVSQINAIQVRDVSVPVPAPEPSQYAALGLGVLGLAGLALKARRRSRVF